MKPWLKGCIMGLALSIIFLIKSNGSIIGIFRSFPSSYVYPILLALPIIGTITGLIMEKIKKPWLKGGILGIFLSILIILTIGYVLSGITISLSSESRIDYIVKFFTADRPILAIILSLGYFLMLTIPLFAIGALIGFSLNKLIKKIRFNSPKIINNSKNSLSMAKEQTKKVISQNILSVDKVNEKGKEMACIKIEKLPLLAKISFSLMIIYLIISIAIIAWLASLFNPILYLLILAIIPIVLLSWYGSKQKLSYRVYLARNGNNLYIKKVFSKSKQFEENIKIDSTTKFILIKNYKLPSHYLLILEKKGQANIIFPAIWDIKKIPLTHPIMGHFPYSENNAKKLSQILKIKYEKSSETINSYANRFKKTP